MCKPSVNLVFAAATLIFLTTFCPASAANLLEGTDQRAEKKSTWAAWGESLSAGFKKGLDAVSKPFGSPNPQEPPADPLRLNAKSKASADLYVAVARSHENKGLVHEAEQQYKKALEETPDHLKATLEYARFLDRQGRLPDAIRYYHRAIKAHPDDSRPLNHLALCLAAHGVLDEAASVMEKAIRLEPKQAVYRNNIAVMLVESGQNEAAFGHLRAVHDEAAAYYNLGYLLQKGGNLEAARKHFAVALQRDPTMSDARTWLEHLQKTAPATEPPASRVAQRPDTAGDRWPTRGPGQTHARTASPVTSETRPPIAPQAGWPSTSRPSRGPEAAATEPRAEQRPSAAVLHQPANATAPIALPNPLRAGTPWPRPGQGVVRPDPRQVPVDRATQPAASAPVERPPLAGSAATGSPTTPQQTITSSHPRWQSFPDRSTSTIAPRSAVPTEPSWPATTRPQGTSDANVVYPLPPVETVPQSGW